MPTARTSDVRAPGAPHPVLRRVAATTAGIAAAGTTALGWGLVEAHRYVLRWTTVPALAEGSRPLRVLHLSDLHLLPGQHGKRDFVQGCLRHAPDMVVVTGDILGHPDVVDDAVALLAPLAEGRPALFTLGSNDFYAPLLKSPARYFRQQDQLVLGRRLDTGRLVAGLEEAGWTSVENRRLTLDTVAGRVDVLGLGDAHVDHDDPSGWAGVEGPADPVLRLGVAHAPYLRVLDRYIEQDADLVLAGHTHGGQVRVPFVGALVANCDLPLRQARGLSAHTPDLWLHVSAGLGTNRFTPIRVACPPEASFVDVVARVPAPLPAGAGDAPAG